MSLPTPSRSSRSVLYLTRLLETQNAMKDGSQPLFPPMDKASYITTLLLSSKVSLVQRALQELSIALSNTFPPEDKLLETVLSRRETFFHVLGSSLRSENRVLIHSTVRIFSSLSYRIATEENESLQRHFLDSMEGGRMIEDLCKLVAGEWEDQQQMNCLQDGLSAISNLSSCSDLACQLVVASSLFDELVEAIVTEDDIRRHQAGIIILNCLERNPECVSKLIESNMYSNLLPMLRTLMKPPNPKPSEPTIFGDFPYEGLVLLIFSTSVRLNGRACHHIHELGAVTLLMQLIRVNKPLVQSEALRTLASMLHEEQSPQISSSVQAIVGRSGALVSITWLLLHENKIVADSAQGLLKVLSEKGCGDKSFVMKVCEQGCLPPLHCSLSSIYEDRRNFAETLFRSIQGDLNGEVIQLLVSTLKSSRNFALRINIATSLVYMSYKNGDVSTALVENDIIPNMLSLVTFRSSRSEGMSFLEQVLPLISDIASCSTIHVFNVSQNEIPPDVSDADPEIAKWIHDGCSLDRVSLLMEVQQQTTEEILNIYALSHQLRAQHVFDVVGNHLSQNIDLNNIEWVLSHVQSAMHVKLFNATLKFLQQNLLSVIQHHTSNLPSLISALQKLIEDAILEK